MFFSVNGPLNAQKAFLTQSDHECFLGVKRALQGTKSFPVKREFVNPENPPNSETTHSGDNSKSQRRASQTYDDR